MNVVNEVFALRDGEQWRIQSEKPAYGRWIAVMARSVEMPEGERQEKRSDGKPVEQAAILACQKVMNGQWQWVQLSPATKESIGDYLFDEGYELNRWYYLWITNFIGGSVDIPQPS